MIKISYVRTDAVLPLRFVDFFVHNGAFNGSASENFRILKIVWHLFNDIIKSIEIECQQNMAVENRDEQDYAKD